MYKCSFWKRWDWVGFSLRARRCVAAVCSQSLSQYWNTPGRQYYSANLSRDPSLPYIYWLSLPQIRLVQTKVHRSRAVKFQLHPPPLEYLRHLICVLFFHSSQLLTASHRDTKVAHPTSCFFRRSSETCASINIIFCWQSKFMVATGGYAPPQQKFCTCNLKGFDVFGLDQIFKWEKY